MQRALEKRSRIDGNQWTSHEISRFWASSTSFARARLKSPQMNELQRLVASLVLGLVDLIFRSPLLDVLFERFATREQARL